MLRHIYYLIALVVLGACSQAYVFHEVTFNFANGTPSTIVSVRTNTPVQRPEKKPVLQGYIFKGWFVDKGKKFLYDFSTLVNTDFVLYAKWEKVTKYQVSFYTGGADPIAPQTITKNEKLPKFEDPQKKDFIFLGWYYSRRYIISYDFNDPIVRDITIYAKWKAEKKGTP